MLKEQDPKKVLIDYTHIHLLAKLKQTYFHKNHSLILYTTIQSVRDTKMLCIIHLFVFLKDYSGVDAYF